jgi:hypothetical protein
LKTEEIISTLQRGKNLYDELSKQNATAGLPPTYSSDFSTFILLGLLSQINSNQSKNPASTSSDLINLLRAQSTMLLSLQNTVNKSYEYIRALALKVAALENMKSSQSVHGSGSQSVSGCIHVGNDGKCSDCTQEKTLDCSSCGDSIFDSRAFKCKNYDNCDNAYCEDDKNELSSLGYCDDCRIVNCDGDCDNDEIEVGCEHRCLNPNCAEKRIFCDDCAIRLLDEKDGQCADCKNAATCDCDECNKAFIETRLTKCAEKDCSNSYCPNCIDELNGNGLCPNCA